MYIISLATNKIFGNNNNIVSVCLIDILSMRTFNKKKSRENKNFKNILSFCFASNGRFIIWYNTVNYFRWIGYVYKNKLLAWSDFCMSSDFILFSRNVSFINSIWVSISLDPDQVRHFVRSDLGPKCLQTTKVVNSRLRITCISSKMVHMYLLMEVNTQMECAYYQTW